MEKTFAPIFIKVSDVARVTKGTYKRGSIRNITFENITATDCYSYFKGREMGSVVWGKPETPIESIEFKKISITAKGGHPVTDGDLNPVENDERFPEHLDVLPAYAWYLRHVKDISFTDCEFRFEKSDGRPAFVIDDTEKVVLKNTTLPIGSKCSSRINVRNQAKDLAILNCIGMSDVKETVSNRNY
jgi:hypothetical protein